MCRSPAATASRTNATRSAVFVSRFVPSPMRGTSTSPSVSVVDGIPPILADHCRRRFRFWIRGKGSAMGVVQTQARVFRRGTNVLDYWLAHAEEFEVSSRSGGTREWVEEVVVDPEAGRAEELILRSWPFRRRTLPAEAVSAVVPGERRLVVDETPGPEPALAAVVRALAVAVNAADAWVRPRLRGATIATLAVTVALVEAGCAGLARLSARVREDVERRRARSRAR